MSRRLILVPTHMEFAVLQPLLQGSEAMVECCGFGPIASAAATAQFITRHQPTHVVLLGIAGTYHDQLAIGSAYSFTEVASYGVGAGTGPHYQSSQELGWTESDDEYLQTAASVQAPAEQRRGLLLSCCAASHDQDEVDMKLAKYPMAVAEDMEGYSVGVACRQHDIPLTIARGISNRAGIRDKAEWKTEDALAAVAVLANDMLAAAFENGI